MNFANTALSVVLIASLPKTGLETSLNTLKYKAVDIHKNSPYCYVQTRKRRTFDLDRLCGVVPKVLPAASKSSTLSGNVTNHNSSAAPQRVCNTPRDIASYGNLCGGRAVTEKKAGK